MTLIDSQKSAFHSIVFPLLIPITVLSHKNYCFALSIHENVVIHEDSPSIQRREKIFHQDSPCQDGRCGLVLVAALLKIAPHRSSEQLNQVSPKTLILVSSCGVGIIFLL